MLNVTDETWWGWLFNWNGVDLKCLQLFNMRIPNADETKGYDLVTLQVSTKGFEN
jgi:hypothetical protein